MPNPPQSREVTMRGSFKSLSAISTSLPTKRRAEGFRFRGKLFEKVDRRSVHKANAQHRSVSHRYGSRSATFRALSQKNRRTCCEPDSSRFDGATPRSLMSIREIRTELAGVIAARTEVVVDHVEQHGQASPMRSIDETLQCVGTAIGLVHRKESDAVITPSVIAIECVATGISSTWVMPRSPRYSRLRNCGVKSALRSEGSDVQFVDDCAR